MDVKKEHTKGKRKLQTLRSGVAKCTDAKKSKPAAESEASDQDDDDEEGKEIGLDGSIDKELEEYTFEFNDMREVYSEGLCLLLKSGFFSNPTSAYEIGTFIAAQTTVGTAISTEDSSDIFGFASILPISAELGKLSEMIQEFRSIELVAKEIGNFIAPTSTTGLLLHRRFSNLPLPLIAHLHRNLWEDVEWCRNQADNEGDDSTTVSKFKNMTHVLLINVCGSDRGAMAMGTAANVTGCSSLLFDAFEDEIYAQHSQFSYLFRSKQCSATLVMSLFALADMRKCIPEISSMCDM